VEKRDWGLPQKAPQGHCARFGREPIFELKLKCEKRGLGLAPESPAGSLHKVWALAQRLNKRLTNGF